VSWDWEREAGDVAVELRRDIGFPVGPLELADQMHLNASVSMVIEHISRAVYGRETGEMIGFLDALDVESDQGPVSETKP
jgi:hypothetical protein